MNRLPLILVGSMFVLASFAGCFGGDDDKDGDDGGNGNGNNTPPPGGNNNTTNPPPGGNNTPPPRTLVAPIPAYTLQMSLVVDGEEVDNQTGPAFVAEPSQQAIFRFDGTPSTDPDGTVEAGSWIIKGPGGEFKAADSKIRFNISSLKATDFGVYEAMLKVLDNDNVLNSTTFYFTLNYVNTFVQQHGMAGPGTAACQTTPEEQEAGSQLGTSGVAPGTYKAHSLTVGANASLINLTLTYTATGSGTGGQNQVTMRLLPAGADKNACGQAIATADAGPSPLAASSDQVGEAGTYIVRVDLVGARIDTYSIAVEVIYSAPAEAPAEPPAEEETA